MTTYVALLRGINVGGKAVVPMAELRSLLASLGHGDVTTYIQSGNVVFTSARPAAEVSAELEEQLEQAFGVRSPVLLRTRSELAGVVSRNPFLAVGADLTKLHVAFLEREPDRAATGGLDLDRSPPDELRVSGREVYLLLPSGAGRTKLTLDWLERRLGARGTQRNWRTVTKLAELAASGDPG